MLSSNPKSISIHHRCPSLRSDVDVLFGSEFGDLQWFAEESFGVGVGVVFKETHPGPPGRMDDQYTPVSGRDVCAKTKGLRHAPSVRKVPGWADEVAMGSSQDLI